jgi:inner membrane protein
VDPISHGVLGITCSQSAARGDKLLPVAVVGALAGLAPDLDVLIRSSTDPLLFLEYHRHFTHALPLAPLGALVCAALLHRWARARLVFRQTYLFCLLGLVSHGLLDACTSYGTELLWPFSDQRVAWSIVSAVDPAFTVPLLVLIVLAVHRRRTSYARAAALWAFTYLALGAAQHERAAAVGAATAHARGHVPVRLEVKPAFGSLLLWKVIYEHEGRYYVDGVRVALAARIYAGTSIEKVDMERHFAWLDPESRQAEDVERFRRLSDDLVGFDAARPERMVDIRYSMVPNEIAGFWGVALDPDAPPDAHVDFVATVDATPQDALRLLKMLF